MSRPLIAVQRYGEGRSLIFAGEGAWRWRMLLPSSDRSYDTFWRQALRWLALSALDPVAIRLPAAPMPGETVAVRILARDAGFTAQADAVVDVDVTTPEGRTERIRAEQPRQTDEDGAYVARYRAPGPGVHPRASEAGLDRAAVATQPIDRSRTCGPLNQDIYASARRQGRVTRNERPTMRIDQSKK